MKWAFVDYENVGSLETLKLSTYERLIVFCGPQHKKLNIGDIPTDSFSRIEIIRMEKTGKNNLDFHLAFYLGAQHQKAKKEITFHIIANDNDYDGLIDHLNKIGRSCSRKQTAKKKTAKKIAKKATKKAAAKQTVTKVKKADGKPPIAHDMHAKILKISQEKRPRTKLSLTSWIVNSSEATEQQAKAVCARMFDSHFVSEAEKGSGLIWSD